MSFFSYYMGASRIISLHTILGPPDHFLRLLYGAPQISFFSYNMGDLSDQFHCLLYGPTPLRSVSLHAIGGATTYFSFFTNYMRAPSDQFLRLLYGAPSG